MSRRFLILLGFTIGSYTGGYLPSLLGAGFFSIESLIGNTVGGILGIWISYKLTAGLQ